jgi:YidC/Oxa1 family membrane protein insertase
MEKRLILAIILSFLVLLGWNYFFNKPKPAPDATAVTEFPSAEAGGAVRRERLRTPGTESAPVQPPTEAAPELTPVGGQSEQDIVVETSLYRAVWTNRGGVLKSWTLKAHRGADGGDLELVPALSKEVGLFPFMLDLEDIDLADRLNAEIFDASPAQLSLADGDSQEVRFVYSDGATLRADKTFRFTGGTYGVETTIKVWKNGQNVPASLLWGPGLGNPSPAELKDRFSAASGAAVYTGGKVTRMDVRKYKPEASAWNFVDWAAYDDNYFAALFVLPPQKGQAVFLKEMAGERPVFLLSVSQPRRAFIGPKETEALKEFGHDAKKVINYGFFGSVSEILLAAVRYFHSVVPNWGLAIIILTFVVKIIFFPLTYSSTKSMAKMAELQPKMKAIKAKYKKAKTDIAQRRQMNEEMMKLYKDHGVNPAGGCLPLLIQLPVFWGVFRMLAVSVEFRHSPFVFWIKDLSVKDPYFVTPILMGITQFISQKMTPTSADPAQAKMMLIMPVIMTVFFLSFPSGLVLYWLTTNVLQIAQQSIMNRMMARHKRESDGKRK